MAAFGLVTPSFADDFERCRLLVQSVRRHLAPDLPHYLIVDRRDYRQFLPLRGGGTEIVVVEDILPMRILRLPYLRRWWFGMGIPPVRNWLLQQVVKLAFCARTSEPNLLLLDSDVIFLRDFDVASLIQNNRLRLFRVPTLGSNPTLALKWHRSAESLLGITAQRAASYSYIGNLISWRRDNVVRLLQRVESISAASWTETVLRRWHFSEYNLYGRFVEDVLGTEASGHFPDSSPLTLGWWEHRSMTDAEMTEFFAAIGPPTVAVMISSKAGIPPSRYASFVLPGSATSSNAG